MSARDDILAAIRSRRDPARPAAYRPPQRQGDAVARFGEAAKRANAQVQVLDTLGEVPQAAAALLRARNLPAVLHLPPDSAAAGLDWASTPGLERKATPPGPDDAALAVVPLGIAETGTLANPSAADAPASWHFRPGFEIAVLKASDIVDSMEEVIARVKDRGLPATLNFVTGPSRTADIEQTLELGAHGPKALAILIVRD